MSTLTLAELGTPLLVLRLLGTEFPDLPAADVSVSTVFPNMLELSFHNGLGDFEAWRQALGIEPGSVTYREQSGGRTRVLRVETDYAGARLRLTGYGEIPSPAVGGAT